MLHVFQCPAKCFPVLRGEAAYFQNGNGAPQSLLFFRGPYRLAVFQAPAVSG